MFGSSFRPVEGSLANIFLRGGTDNVFYLDTPEAFYVAVFNFNTSQELSLSLDKKRLGVETSPILRSFGQVKSYRSRAKLYL